jgi:hypothetical protein
MRNAREIQPLPTHRVLRLKCLRCKDLLVVNRFLKTKARLAVEVSFDSGRAGSVTSARAVNAGNPCPARGGAMAMEGTK